MSNKNLKQNIIYVNLALKISFAFRYHAGQNAVSLIGSGPVDFEQMKFTILTFTCGRRKNRALPAHTDVSVPPGLIRNVT